MKCIVPTTLVLLLFATTAGAVAPPITALAFTPDGKSVVVGSQAGVQVRTWPDQKLARFLATKLAHVHDIAFAPDGKSLALAGGDPAEHGIIELFRWPDEKLLHRATLHKDVIYSVAWSTDSKFIATAAGDRTVRVVDTSAPEKSRTLDGHSRPVLAAVFLPGNDKLVTAGVDESLRVWNIATGRPERVLSNHTRPVYGLAVRPARELSDAPMVASVSDDRTVRLWQPTLGRMVRFARLPSEPRAVAWTKDGKLILVICKDGGLRVVDPDTAEVGAAIPAIDGVAYCLAVAPVGSVLVGGSTGQLRRVQLLNDKR